MKKLCILLAGLLLTINLPVFGDGDPEFVKLPADYQTSFTNYATFNRDGKELVAKMYANDAAMASYRDDQQADPGSILIMEIYKPKKDAEGKAIVADNGVFEMADLAAIAVMERSDSWSSDFPAEHRLAGWGFSFYGANGEPKENELPCVACHTPLENQDYLFSYQQLLDYVKSN